MTNTLAAQIVEAIRELAAEVRALRLAPKDTAPPFAISVKEARARLGCSERQVEKLIARGTLERAPSFGRTSRVTVASVELAERDGVKPAQRPARRLQAASAWKPIDPSKL